MEQKLKNKFLPTLKEDIASLTVLCGLETVVLRGESKAADNRKINANFLFGGFIASYESWCVNEQLCFVSTMVRKLPQIKNFVYPLCVVCNSIGTVQPSNFRADIWTDRAINDQKKTYL